MDDGTFDRLTLVLGRLARSRRAILGSGLGLGTLAWPDLLDARKKKRKRKKRRKRKHKKHKRKKATTKDVIFNDFGCVDVGAFCTSNDQCCSGICTGPGEKTCQAHDQSTCLAGQSDGYCKVGSVELGCVTSTNESGVCLTTTGNGPYCALSGQCFSCQTDADCVPFCGPAAACIVCTANCGAFGGTMCAKPSSGACAFP